MLRQGWGGGGILTNQPRATVLDVLLRLANEVDATSRMGWGGVGRDLNKPTARYAAWCSVALAIWSWRCAKGGIWTNQPRATLLDVLLHLTYEVDATSRMGWGGAGRDINKPTQCIDRSWKSLKVQWMGLSVNATRKENGHTVLSPVTKHRLTEAETVSPRIKAIAETLEKWDKKDMLLMQISEGGDRPQMLTNKKCISDHGRLWAVYLIVTVY